MQTSRKPMALQLGWRKLEDGDEVSPPWWAFGWSWGKGVAHLEARPLCGTAQSFKTALLTMNADKKNKDWKPGVCAGRSAID